jgi:predicted nucleic acid-binding protein
LTADSLCLVDSNVLVNWVQMEQAGVSIVRTAIDVLVRQGIELCYASQNLGEFWNVSTRPTSRNGFGLSPAEADHRAKSFERRMRLLPEHPLVHEEWRRLLVTYQVSGVQVHDTHLVAVMNVYGVTQILTYNTKDFRRFTGIEALDPADVARTA